jgi:hypothetical protein
MGTRRGARYAARGRARVSDSTGARATRVRFETGAGGRARGAPGTVAAMTPQTGRTPYLLQHAPQNVLEDAGDIARFYDSCSDLMRELLDALAADPDRPRPFPEIEDAMGWPRRRIASVLGGVAQLRLTQFRGGRPYRFLDEHASASGRWELWMDAGQARAVRAARRA